MDTNDEGVEKVPTTGTSSTACLPQVENSNGKYAFFMESASIEYLVERRCKLSQVQLFFLLLLLFPLPHFPPSPPHPPSPPIKGPGACSGARPQARA